MTATTATATNATTPAAAAPAGFLLPCPCCGENDARISLNLAALGEDDAFTCAECDGMFSVETVRGVVARWRRVLAWVDTVPTFDE